MEPSDKQGQNILIHIRNDEIEVAEDKIRLNENVLLAQEITGIRCSEILKWRIQAASARGSGG